ncbi:MAG: hypothetical protein H0T45_03305 [Pyrinomonadaceae bacterium]|nr:hypothetical protein [Pyrinomonadaceae bacterium]
MNLGRLIDEELGYLEAIDQAETFVGGGGDSAIFAKLQACLDARALIPDELARSRDLAANADNDIERAYLVWQGATEAKKIERAAECAARRLRLLESLKTEADYQRERERCAGQDGTIYWFGMYAWGYDPRSLLKVQPFEPFEYQERYLRWLDETVLRRRTSGMVEKSRDMGATVGALDWVVKHWLFVPGFSAFLVSANEDLVDSKADPDTLFEKVRFQLRLTPSWMLPGGFNLQRDLPYMNIANPANGAVISGGAPTESVGRQRRASVVVADEFQSWPGGAFKQNTALSQTSNSVVKLGTPLGMMNQYATDAHTPGVNKFEMDWREHPWKSQAWFNALPYGYGGSPMTVEAIAQEVSRDYHASQPGQVFKNWREREPYVLITWAELVAYYGQFNLDRHFFDEDGNYRVPVDWNWGRMQDYGQTAAHKWVISHGARPRANYPLSDSFFVFGYLVPPTGAAVGEVQPLIEAQQRRLGFVGEPELSQMSHEQCGEGGVAQTFMDEHGEYWEAWNTDYNLGLPQIQEWLMLMEQTKPNPIRPQLIGRTRLYFVCADEEIKLAFNPRTKEHFVTPSKSDLSFKLAREEMTSYHYPLEEMGKPVQLMRPEKKKGMDNFIDTLRGFATQWGPSVAPMTRQEWHISQLPDALKPAEVIALRGTPAFVETYMEQQQTLKQIELREQRREEEEQQAWSRFMGRPVTHRRYRGGRN